VTFMSAMGQYPPQLAVVKSKLSVRH